MVRQSTSIFQCPHCDARVSRQPYSGDYVHDCNSDPKAITTLKKEDVVITGNAEDFDGSFTIGPSEVMLQGAQNAFFGTRAHIEGENFDRVTARGSRSSTHRSRSHLQYVDVEK